MRLRILAWNKITALNISTKGPRKLFHLASCPLVLTLLY
jgi:hypothetical protein